MRNTKVEMPGRVLEYINSNDLTPCLLMDRQLLVSRYKELVSAFQGVSIAYSAKANSDPGVINELAKIGAEFDVTSMFELNTVLHTGTPPQNIRTSNPIKQPELIEALYKIGSDIFVYDSRSEIDKLAKYAPGSKAILRISVSNQGSLWPLIGKFGVEPNQAASLVEYAISKGIANIGYTFHVGSQCEYPRSWANAIKLTADISKAIYQKTKSITKLINLGGGLPIYYDREVPLLEDIAKQIRNSVSKHFNNNLELQLDLGRAISGPAGFMVTKVIGKADRKGQKWIYLDTGLFHGAMEAIQGFIYPFYFPDGDRPKSIFTLGGPTCDSFDILWRKISFPDLNVGERVVFKNAGAYTAVYSSSFNGFDGPKIVLIK